MAGGGGMGVETGATFGKWTVLGLFEGRRDVYYVCRCVCGTEKPVAKSSLLQGTSTRCRRCSNISNTRARKARQRPIEAGSTIDLWTVLGEAEVRGGNLYMLCRCVCGAEHEVMASTLRHGRSKSCGICSRKARAKHGESSGAEAGITPEYRAWSMMKARCYTTSNKKYPDYGGRGIEVCEEWLASDGFEKFLEHVGRKPSPTHSIHRIDNDGNYEPGNTKWATRKEQNRHRRNSVLVTINGETKCLAEWAESSPVKYETARKRLKKGWSPEDALFGGRA